MDQHQTQRTRFLDRFFDNLEAGTTPDLESYLHDFPEIEEFVRNEFAAHIHDQPPPLGDPGRYVVEAPLARGGMGELYIARDQRLDRQVVLKSVPPGWQTTNAIRRLQREARALGRVDHPSICPILDVFELDGSWTIVLPLLHGQTLAHCIEVSRSATPHPPCTVLPDANPSAPLPRLLEWIAQVCQAVAAVHGQGIIHRDLKPGNLFLRDDGTPIVLDFGLALDETDTDQRLTLSGDQVGTPLYMAPEQVEGKACDARTDVYALGVILYETLALTHPFEGSTRAETFRKIQAGNAAPLRSINPSIPRDLAAVCHKAIERLPAHRYATADALASDLLRVLQLEPTKARPDSGVRRIVRHVRRRPGRSSAVIVLVLATLTLSIQQIVEARVRAQTIKAQRQSNVMAAAAGWKDYQNARSLQVWDEARKTLARYSEAAPLDAPIGLHLRINAAIEFFNYFADPTTALALLDATIAHLETCSPWGEEDRMVTVRHGIALGARPLAGSREDILGWALERRGYIRMHSGDLAGSVADLEQSLPLLVSTGNKHRWTNAIHELGEACLRLGDPRG
ncbi:MAG: serine/threonine-protein kinase, partial [Planctomycetota bacterium]|nr:serine/threonine-protein kinase [Planctomycetota bacterium]